MDEMLLKLCAGCVMDNMESPDIGETLPKFLMKFRREKKKNYAPITLYRGEINKN